LRRGTPGHMQLPHRLQDQKVKSQGGAGAYCGGDLAAQIVNDVTDHWQHNLARILMHKAISSNMDYEGTCLRDSCPS